MKSQAPPSLETGVKIEAGRSNGAGQPWAMGGQLRNRLRGGGWGTSKGAF